MSQTRGHFVLVAMFSTPWISACSGDMTADDVSGGTAALGGATASVGGGAPSGRGGTGGKSSGTGGTGAGGTSPTGAAGGSAGTAVVEAGRGGIAGQAAGGIPGAGTGSAAGSAGSSGAAAGGATSAGSGGTGFGGGAAGGPPVAALDCGKDGWAVENHGPPENRVNYLILGDGYTAETVNTTLVAHVNAALKRRFETESGQPYGRYRNFVNICVAKVASQNDGIGNGPTAFDGGNGGDRLAKVSESKVTQYIKDNIPPSFEIDWKAVVLNQSKWENTGAVLMLWSGGHAEGPGAALHEGGHGFHQLADEYCAAATGSGCGKDTSGTGTQGTEYSEVNSTGDPETTGGKWDLWLGTTQKGLNVPDQGATGVQGTFQGSRYADSGQYRPSSNSMMNSLFTEAVDTSFNSVSREQIIFSIWRAVRPIDSTEPAAGTTAAPAAVSNPETLTVNVVDPAVINVDWTVDGTTHANAGTTFDTSVLAAGMHTVVAKAYDNASMDLVKLRTSACPSSVKDKFYCHATAWKNSEQEVAWTVTSP